MHVKAGVGLAVDEIHELGLGDSVCIPHSLWRDAERITGVEVVLALVRDIAVAAVERISQCPIPVGVLREIGVE